MDWKLFITVTDHLVGGCGMDENELNCEPIEVSGTFRAPTDGTGASLKLASQIIDRANDVAIRTVATARRQVAAKLNSIKCRAKKLGQKRSIKSAQRELAAIKSQMATDFERMLSNFKNDCLDLCLTITKDVVADELVNNPQSIKKRISRAVQQLSRSTKYKAYLNPEDKEAAVNKPQPKNISDFELDPSIPRNVTRLESTTGSIVIDPYQHFNRIAAEIKNTLLSSEVN